MNEKNIQKHLARMNGGKKATIAIIVVSIFIAVVLLGGMLFLSVGNQREYVITNVYIQTELQHSTNDDQTIYSTKYLYFCTTDSGEEIVFENEDNIFFGKFNSSDILAKMRKYEQSKEPFKIKTAGFRIGFFSTYQNIIAVYDI